MKNSLIAVISVLLIVALYLSNPSKEDFSERYADQINAELAQELGITAGIGNLLGGFSQTIIEELLLQQTRRDNYLVASVFTVPTAREDIRVLGIAGRFISLGQN